MHISSSSTFLDVHTTALIYFAKPLLELAKKMAAEFAKKTSLAREYRHHPLLYSTPSYQVIEGFRSTFATVLNRRLNGLIDAI